jgi:hypothetical protein
MNIVILIQLLLAHILNDFVIQSNKWVNGKKTKGINSRYFWIHIFLSGLLTYIFLMQWTAWLVPVFIIVTHGFIDFWKINQEKKIEIFNATQENDAKKKTGKRQFFFDQLFHIIMILIAWLYLTKGFKEVLPFLESMLSEKNFITIITATIFIIWPVGVAIGKITEPFKNELSSDEENDSLTKAGKYIGIFERLMVMIFIFTGQYEAIGFLIAAKSVLRIGKDDDKLARKKTEYVLIGTLISFTTAIVVGLLVKSIISN